MAGCALTAIDQIAYVDALKKYHKTACTVFLRMNT